MTHRVETFPYTVSHPLGCMFDTAVTKSYLSVTGNDNTKQIDLYFIGDCLCYLPPHVCEHGVSRKKQKDQAVTI